MPSAAAATPRRGFGKVAGLLRETMFKNLCGSYGNTAEGNQENIKNRRPQGNLCEKFSATPRPTVAATG